MQPTRLQPGSRIRCPHCHRWHAVVQRHTEGTKFTRQMLYWECRGQYYYAGQLGTPGRHETRQPDPPAGEVDTNDFRAESP
jgi:hypothetical protein